MLLQPRRRFLILFDSQSPTILVRERDKRRFEDIFIRETFDSSRNELTLEGSCGPYRRLLQLQNPGNTVAENSGSKLILSEFDHSWSTGGKRIILSKAGHHHC